MMRKLVREVARKHGLTHSQTFDMLVDFLESMIEEDKIVTQDLVDYFEEEMVAAAKSGEWDAPKAVPESNPYNIPETATLCSALAKPKVEAEPLDADTREIVKFLLDKHLRVETPVDIKFLGTTKAVVALMKTGYFMPPVAVVTKVGGKLVYSTVNSGSATATVE